MKTKLFDRDRPMCLSVPGTEDGKIATLWYVVSGVPPMMRTLHGNLTDPKEAIRLCAEERAKYDAAKGARS